MSRIELRNLSKQFGDLTAVSDVTVTVEDGELLCLLGPSGCGKSTTLRMIGGLETPSSGEVNIGGADVTDTPPYERDTSIVFQNWELFPHKSVLENVAFGLKMQGVGKDERRSRAREMLERVEMNGYESYDPADLSGGQKQRVALARSLAVDPEVLLLDEPLSNLDKRLREQVEIRIKEIHDQLEKTFIYVTHNQDEAFTLADRIGIMNDGRLVQVGDPIDVYQNPHNQFIEEFLGDTNIVTGTVRFDDGLPVVETDFGSRVALPEAARVDSGDTIRISFRPEFLTVRRAADEPPSGHDTVLEGTVENILYRGAMVRYYVRVNGTELFVDRHVGNRLDLAAGTNVQLSWTDAALLLFHEDGTKVETEDAPRAEPTERAR